jgi:hypothetical protein
MPAGEIDMKSRFNILMSALSASLLTTLAPVTAQDAGRKSSMPVQAASTNAGPPGEGASVATYFSELVSQALADSYRHHSSFLQKQDAAAGPRPRHSARVEA